MPLTSNSADVFPSEFENIDLALSPWYFEHGYYRVLRLVDCIPDCGVYRGILPVVQLLASEYDLQVAAGQHHLLDIAAFSGLLDMFVYLWEWLDLVACRVLQPSGLSKRPLDHGSISRPEQSCCIRCPSSPSRSSLGPY
ncbi:hypothetical protein Ae201684P_017289 [Aphanomyces euteiches]|nr:hypothetical protein Ae201684P_017289 [Aphanomyces euteiches]